MHTHTHAHHCFPQAGYQGLRPPLLVNMHVPYETVVPRVAMVEFRITNFFTATPAQKRSRQDSDSDIEAGRVPCPVPFLTTSTASDTSVSAGSGTTLYVAAFTCKSKHKVGYDPKWNEGFD